MALKWIGQTHRDNLSTYINQDLRFYFGFRDREYPPIGDDFTFTAIGSADNQPGSHNLTGGSGKFLIPLTDTITIACRVKPNFAFDTASNQPIWSWYYDANNYLTFFYNATDDKFTLKWKDGGTERTAETAAYLTGQVLDVWFDFSISLDLTTGDATGVSLNVNRTEVDTSWSGVADVKGINYQLFELRAEAGTEGDYDINYVRIFLNKACTAAEIADDFKAIKNEEIWIPLNGCAIGWDRCNITRHVQQFSLSKGCEKYNGPGSNEMRIELKSENGQFADDQHAAFDPTNDLFNGTASQKYLQNRSRIFAETWNSNIFQPFFVGRVMPTGYMRDTPSEVVGIQTVHIEMEDQISELARNFDEVAHTYAGKAISSATQADSLVHAIARIGTQKTISNYASNSSFENATIANSWAVAGAGATFSRVAGGLTGSFQGDLVYGAAACSVTQTITFTGTRKLDVGKIYTFGIFLLSTGACGDDIKLAENDAGGENDSTTAAYVIAGGEGWTLWTVTHTITDSDSTKLLISIELDDNVTLSMDDAFLVEGAELPTWIVLNNNDGASAVESADDADSDSYDTCGFDCDLVADTLTWVTIKENKPVWEDLQDLGVAALAEYIGFDSAGTFVLRSYMKTGYADPTPILTVTSMRGMSAIIDIERANRIIVNGVKVARLSQEQGLPLGKLWDIENSGEFSSGQAKLAVAMANGDVFPEVASYGTFWVRIS